MKRQKSGVNGRSSRLLAVFALAFASSALAPAPVFAQAGTQVEKIDAAAAKAEIAVQSLRGGVSVLSGSGGNIVVLAGNDGKLLVDAGIAVSRPKIQAALDAIGPSPIKFLVNTHYHWDHTDGNAWVHEAGAKIVAQENTLARLSAPQRVEEWKHTFPAAPAAARPTVTFKSTKTIEFDGETLALEHHGPGHTDGDLLVYFKRADVLVLGDIWWNGYYPMIDVGAGGSIDGTIRWVEIALARATPKTIVVPGHGPVGDRAQLAEFRDMLVAVRANVARLKREGRSLDEVVAARPTAAFDAKWGRFVIDGDLFTRLVYAGV